MNIKLNQLSKGEPDWHIPLNENATTIESAFEVFAGSEGVQQQLDEIRELAESKLPENYDTLINLDNVTDAGVYGVVDPFTALDANDVAFLTLRGGDNTDSKLHQIAFPFTNNGSSPSMHTRTLQNGTWSDWSLRASGIKTLWSGVWAEGDILVPNLNDYVCFLISMAGQGTVIPAYRLPGSQFIRGVGGYAPSASYASTYHFSGTVVEETISFVNCKFFGHYPSGGHGAFVDATVTGINGITLA